ncbi:hypothetical protein N7475_008217 [Penicillium sp. IBT 31633x]|nr:hypothetical protein N7475_008217 [Penicillium sp. IBT 31633x]
MSFGVGFGEFLAVIQLVKETRKAFVEAPRVVGRVRNLSLVLQDVEIDISTKELSSQQQADLCTLTAGCYEVLSDISKKIEDYT